VGEGSSLGGYCVSVCLFAQLTVWSLEEKKRKEKRETVEMRKHAALEPLFSLSFFLIFIFLYIQ
jgi:hypothetical protein